MTKKGVRQVPARIRTDANGIPTMNDKAHVVSIKPTALERLAKGTASPAQALDPISKEFFEIAVVVGFARDQILGRCCHQCDRVKVIPCQIGDAGFGGDGAGAAFTRAL